MPYERKYTDAELSEMRSKLMREKAKEHIESGKKWGGGKHPRGKSNGIDKCTTISVRQLDTDFVRRMSVVKQIPMSTCVRILVLKYRAEHPEVKLGNEREQALDLCAEKLSKWIVCKPNTDRKPNAEGDAPADVSIGNAEQNEEKLTEAD